MAVPNFPKGPTNQNKTRSNSPAGAQSGGVNTGGSSTKYTGPSGPFDYGQDKHGFINPFGKIAYGTAGTSKAKKVPWANVQNQAWSQGETVPAAPTVNPSYADAYYAKNLAGHQATFREEQAQRLHNMAMMQDELTSKERSLGKQKDASWDTLGSTLGASGMSESGAARSGLDDINFQYKTLLDNALREFGPEAQGLEKTMLALAAQRYTEAEGAESAAAAEAHGVKYPTEGSKVSKKKDKKNG